MRLLTQLLAGAFMALALTACDTEPDEDAVAYETESPAMTEGEEADAYDDSVAATQERDMHDQPMPPADQPMASEDEFAADTTIETSAEQPLTDSQGRPLYVLEVDRQGEIQCVDECAEIWAPVVATETEIDTSDPNIQVALIDSIERPDGVVQLTYNGYPLYHYPDDTEQDLAALEESSGKWFLITADGNRIEEDQQTS